MGSRWCFRGGGRRWTLREGVSVHPSALHQGAERLQYLSGRVFRRRRGLGRSGEPRHQPGRRRRGRGRDSRDGRVGAPRHRARHGVHPCLVGRALRHRLGRRHFLHRRRLVPRWRRTCPQRSPRCVQRGRRTRARRGPATATQPSLLQNFPPRRNPPTAPGGDPRLPWHKTTPPSEIPFPQNSSSRQISGHRGPLSSGPGST